MAKELEVRIKPDGAISFETFGMKGSEECSKIIERATVGIGGTIEKDNKKPEFYDKGKNVYIRS